MRIRVTSWAVCAALCATAPMSNVRCQEAGATYSSAETQPRYYVGEKTCRKCHRGEEHGNIFSVWRSKPHARAYTALALPEAKQIAEISGVNVDPQKSPICLGCHSTASAAEDWELGEDFRRIDGVQCEGCHGPGSEYANREVMLNPEKSKAAGLMMPDCNACLDCHREKGSHTAVLKTKKFDCETMKKEIAHPLKTAETGEWPERPRVPLADRHYIGVQGCAACHREAMMGYQFSLWRRSKHAQAYATLGLPQAKAIAQKIGLDEDPQQSKACLRCHATGFDAMPSLLAPAFEVEDGVQCETCHGPGSQYSTEAVMLDPRASAKLGLVTPGPESCLQCHNEQSPTYRMPFDYAEMWPKIAHPTRHTEEANAPRYKTPYGVALTGDGRTLCVACEESDSLILVDTATRKVIGEIPLQRQPFDVCTSPDDRLAYVSNRGSDTLSVIDLAAREVVATVPVGDEPHGVAANRQGTRIFVANAGTCDVSVIDGESFEPLWRVPASRNTWSARLSPDGRQVYVSNGLPLLGEFRAPSVAEVTVIDASRGSIAQRHMVPDANLIQGVAFVPGRRFALVTLLRTKHLVPMIRLQQGWTITNGLGVIWDDGRVDQVLLDQPDSCFADPTDVVATPDGRFAYVSGGGIDAVAAIDLDALERLLTEADEKTRQEVLPNHLAPALEFVIRRIPVGRSPRGMVVSPDGRFVYVANGLDDTVSVISVRDQEVVGTIDLGGPQEITKARYGNRLFHSASITYQNQFSCHSCHPDGHVDGLAYDIEPDGIGINPVDNRTLRGVLDTAPFKWSGLNPSLSRQCGPRLAVFFTRIDPFTPEELSALDYYITTIPRPPNRYRPLGADLSDAQRRGKDVFFRMHDNLGREIPLENRCSFCHSGSYFTNARLFDVGSGSPLDTKTVFDVPHLNNIYDSSPYLHDGRSHTLEEIWTRFNPGDTHGVTNDMTKDQLNDLVEYLNTL